MAECAVCGGPVTPYREVEAYTFHACGTCGLIQLDAATLARIDGGEAVFSYAQDYWATEMAAARERAYGIALARAAEVFLCARRPVQRFLDIGSGPGTFLDAVAAYLPHIADRFHAVELFPPPEQDRTRQANYRIGRVRDFPAESFDGGICVEVVEHLTPRMVDGLFGEIAAVSRDGACYLINTGLAAFTREECPDYLDPIHRGHITIWTVEAADRLARPHGLAATAMPGRKWCFMLEKAQGPRPGMDERTAAPLPENKSALCHPGAGAGPVGLLAEVALREAHVFDNFIDRTRWALSLNAENEVLRARLGTTQARLGGFLTDPTRALRRLAASLRHVVTPPRF